MTPTLLTMSLMSSNFVHSFWGLPLRPPPPLPGLPPPQPHESYPSPRFVLSAPDLEPVSLVRSGCIYPGWCLGRIEVAHRGNSQPIRPYSHSHAYDQFLGA